LPASVYIGNASTHPGAGFFPPAHQPLFVNNPENGLKNVVPQKGLSKEMLAARMQLAGNLDGEFRATFPQRNVKAYAEMYDGAAKMMNSRDLSGPRYCAQEKQEIRDAYGKGAFGQGCLLARRLVESGVCGLSK